MMKGRLAAFRRSRLFRIVLAAGALLTLAGAALGVYRLAHSFPAGSDPAGAVVRVAGSAAPFPSGVLRLDADLEAIRARHKVPALACAVVKGEQVFALGVVGARRAGRPEAAAWTDRFHIGSDTKAMTATVAAMLIEDGRLRWDSTLAELFPEMAGDMRPEYRAVTVDMLMHHLSGLPDDRSDLVIFVRLRALSGSPVEQRLAATRLGLRRAPAHPPGTRNQYANMNFTILGAVIERVTGEPWESQLRKRLFEPLGMRTAGFGSPSSPGQVDQPWGHTMIGPLPPRLLWSERTMLPASTGPAGNVSLSMSDWARFAALHLQAARGQCRLLPCEAFGRLHREDLPGSRFAGGWGLTRNDGDGRLLQHAGSDGWWYAVILLVPDLDRAYLAAANAGGERGRDSCTDALALARSAAQRTSAGM